MQLDTSEKHPFCALAGSFAPTFRYEKSEIHKVFRTFHISIWNKISRPSTQKSIFRGCLIPDKTLVREVEENMKVTDIVTEFAKPIVEAHGCTLWDVEYVREGSERFLRLYLDKEGGVDITDCEAISRAIDPILDEKDPIAESYHFEVCSAGLERALKRPSDFERFMGSPIMVKLYRPRNGLKEIPGILRGYEEGRVTVEAGKETITFEKSELALVRLRVEF
jgi:ribosome maturation factor RimP